MNRRKLWQGVTCALLIVCIVSALAFSPTAEAVALTTASLGTLLMLGLSSIGVNLNWSESTTGETITNKVVDDFSTFCSNSAINISDFISGFRFVPADKKIITSKSSLDMLVSFVQFFIGNGSISEGSSSNVIYVNTIDNLPFSYGFNSTGQYFNYDIVQEPNLFLSYNDISTSKSSPTVIQLSNGQIIRAFRSTPNYIAFTCDQGNYGWGSFTPNDGYNVIGLTFMANRDLTALVPCGLSYNPQTGIYQAFHANSTLIPRGTFAVNSNNLFASLSGVSDVVSSSLSVSVPADFVESLPVLGTTDHELSDGTTVSLPDDYVITLPESFPGLSDLTGLDDLGTVSLPDILADGTTSDLDIESEVIEAEVPVEPPVDTDWNFDDIGDLFTTRFPFSIPWDVGAALTAISAEPVEPDFSVNIFSDVDSIEDDTEIETKISDIPGIDVIHEILRWGSIALFAVGLAVATKHLIWTS